MTPTTLCADHGNTLKCQSWTDLSPELQGESQPQFLPAKMYSSVAVKFDNGLLVIAIKEGSIRHATFVPGRHDNIR